MSPHPDAPELRGLSVGWVPGDEPADPRVVAYLEAGHVLMVARCLARDELDPSRGDRVPIGTATDGTWVWPLSAGYYVKEHGVSVPPQFVEHAAAREFTVPPRDAPEVEAAFAAYLPSTRPPQPGPQRRRRPWWRWW